MNEAQLREILAQEYEKAGFGESRVTEIRGGSDLLPDRTQAALAAMRRIAQDIEVKTDMLIRYMEAGEKLARATNTRIGTSIVQRIENLADSISSGRAIENAHTAYYVALQNNGGMSLDNKLAAMRAALQEAFLDA